MRNIVQVSIFRIIQIIWLPITLAGYAFLIIRLIMYSRKSEVSSTTLATLQTRWMQHQLGTRPDEPVARLMKILPNTFGLPFVMTGTLLAHRLTGYVPRIYRYPYEGVPPAEHESTARTTFFDIALNRHLYDIDQLVILGAGWDTRSYRIPKKIRCFELDREKTQQTKRQMLQKAGLDTMHITFVAADLMKDDWLEKLVNAGFDPHKPTFFLWEAVTPYLNQEVIESILRKIAGTASGSVVTFDYFHSDFTQAHSFFWRYVRTLLNAIGEPFKFGFELTTPSSNYMAAFLASCSLSMEEQRNFGPETDHKPALAGFTTAIVPAR